MLSMLNVRVARVFVSSPIDVAAERGRVQAIAAAVRRGNHRSLQ